MTNYEHEENWVYLSLQEVSSSFGVTTDLIMEIIDEGIVTAHINEQKQMQFDAQALRCIRTTLRLHRDLGVNMAGAALALELLEEIERLRGLVTRA